MPNIINTTYGYHCSKVGMSLNSEISQWLRVYEHMHDAQLQPVSISKVKLTWDITNRNDIISESFGDRSCQPKASRPMSSSTDLSPDVEDGPECILLNMFIYHNQPNQPSISKVKITLDKNVRNNIISEPFEDVSFQPFQLPASRSKSPSIDLSLGTDNGSRCIFIDKLMHQTQPQPLNANKKSILGKNVRNNVTSAPLEDMSRLPKGS